MVKINCFIIGRGSSQDILTLEIMNPMTIFNVLKDIIMDKYLQDALIDEVTLYKACFPVDEMLEDNIKRAVGEGQLSPVAELWDVFSDVDDRHLHVLVKYEPITTPNILQLNCAIIGNCRLQNILTVAIKDTEDINALERAIKAKRCASLRKYLDHDLVLYKVFMVFDQAKHFDRRNSFPLPPKGILSHIFSGRLDSNRIHVMIGLPDSLV